MQKCKIGTQLKFIYPHKTEKYQEIIKLSKNTIVTITLASKTKNQKQKFIVNLKVSLCNIFFKCSQLLTPH